MLNILLVYQQHQCVELDKNFYGLEKTLWRKANPNRVFDWRSKHGILVEDRFSYSKYKWTEFRNYDDYIKKSTKLYVHERNR